MAEKRYQLDEMHQRSQEIYERVIKPTLRREDIGTYIAVDLGTEDYEVDRDEYNAVARLRKRRPADAQVYLLRAGYLVSAKLGGGWPPGSGESL